MRSLKNFDWKEFIIKKKLKRLLGILLNHYRLATLEYINPKVVITYIDNSELFHWLSRNCNGSEFFAIQNGNRTNWELERVSKNDYYLKHFFCFGNYDVDRFKAFNLKIDDFYPIGSLKGGIILSEAAKHINNNKYDICFISSGTLETKSKEFNRDYYLSYELLITYLAKFIEEFDLSISVALRFDKKYFPGLSKLEKEHFDCKFSKKADLIEMNRLSTYFNALDSSVLIGSGTSVLAECFGFGKKILYCDFSERKIYNNHDSMVLFTEPNYDSFKNRLNELINEPYDKYCERTRDYRSYVMNYNMDCLPHVFIRKKIKEYL
ncbi:MAG: hypothetical protein IIA61_11435 [Candidatus Marinimicrobia bacterium]|nr:hypothetical protein [Candidatus Neomarinimicrobiota bacterium]